MKSPEEGKGLVAEIKMETVLKQEGTVERHLFEEMGKVLHMNGSHYIRYEETHDNKTIPVTIKITADGIVSLIRRGETTTRLRFDANEWTETNYQVATGILIVRVKTEELMVQYSEHPFSGELSINYGLYIGEEKLGDYQMRLRFTT